MTAPMNSVLQHSLLDITPFGGVTEWMVLLLSTKGYLK